MMEMTDIRKAKDLLETYSALGSSLSGGKLADIRAYGKILRGIQWTVESGMAGLQEEFEASPVENLSDGEKTACILQMGEGITWMDTELLEESVLERYPGTVMEVVPKWDPSFEGSRLTLIVYLEGERRPRYSQIRSRYHYLELAEKREKKSLLKEMERLGKADLIAVTGRAELSGMMEKRHVLWHGAASSNTSASVIVDRLKKEIGEQTDRYDVKGMLIFLDVDGSFTTLSEVAAVRDGLAELLDAGAEVAMNIVAEKSHVKSISCRVYLFGNPRYILGDVNLDFGRYEILLYQSEDREVGHLIVASYCDGELTVSRYDWGQYDRNSRGQTDEHHYYDKENTARLCEALKARRPETLLRRLKSRFAVGARAAFADDSIRRFCSSVGVEFESRYYD